VSQQQNRLSRSFSRDFGTEVDLQAVAEIDAAMEFGPSAQRFKPSREERRDPVDRWLVVAGGFNFHQFADGLEHLVLTLFEVPQAVSPEICRRARRLDLFLSGHISPLPIRVCFAVKATRYSIIFRLFETNP